MKPTRIFLALVATASLAAGCGNRDRLPFLGQWTGKFVVDHAEGVKNPQSFGMKAALQLYATKNRFAFHLEAEQQKLDITGVWSLKNGSVVLESQSVTIDDNGGADKRNPNLAFIPSDELKKPFSTTIPLRPNASKKTMTGLIMVVGPATGHLELAKETSGSNY